MGIVSIILLVIFVVTCFLLILLVLMQDEQGEGLGGIFGGGGSQIGSRSGNILTRFTTLLASVFLITSFGLAWINRTTDRDDLLGAAQRQESGQREVVEWWLDTEADMDEGE